MSEQNQPSSITHTSRILEAADVTKLIKEELDRNNKYLEFAQGQIEKDRSFYKHLYAYAAAFLAFMIAVAGIFSYNSVNQMRNDIKTSVDAELTNEKAEIAKATTDAESQVRDELANVRVEVQKRLDTEFQSENIKTLVANAARERTERELAGIIRSEASQQVAKGITEQRPLIQKTVEDQTKDAVNQLQPTIKTLVAEAAENQVNTSVAPIRDQMKTYGDFIRIGTMATLARNDDRTSLDYLLQVALGKKPESANPDLRKLAEATASAVIADTESGLYLARSFKQTQSPEAMKNFMRSNNRLEREAALDSYPQNDKTILPILVEIIRTDQSISVVYKATSRLNALTNQSFEFWKTADILAWWDRNRTSFMQ
ncbi:MAG TPA: hypothetical protein VG322_04075 [Candidatus Acidoferrales bacterium]|jgi:hypothetical protein|nr:hypothetical protein [Candidatus Acidoferrales bacterium]